MNKIPPQAQDVERYILGACIEEQNTIGRIIDIVSPNMFYSDIHSKIFTAISELFANSIPIDIISIVDKLQRNGDLKKCGGASYISDLTNEVVSTANVEHSAYILVQKFMQREVIRISQEAIKDAYEDTVDVFDLVDNLSLKSMTINELKSSNIKSLTRIKNNIKKGLLSNEPLAKCFNLGINGLDFLSKTFNIVAGYQGTGKTAFIMSASTNIAKNGYRVGILSAEMSEDMLGARALQSDLGISSKRIISNDLSEQEKDSIVNSQEKEYDNNIFVDDSTELNYRNIITKIKTFVQKFRIDIVFVDYMQLIDVTEKGMTDVRGNERLSNRLQVLAKKLDISIIGLSQLARDNSGDRPTAMSIRGGGLEQAASDIFILYDENWKKNNGAKWNDIAIDERGKIEVIYAKGRYSSVANNYLYFDKPRQKLISWNDWFGSPMYAQEAERMMQSANNNNSSMQNNSNGFDIF
ncbi:MAG TPA: replicative DNA helicase [Paludibacteraceae bacterium]|nr:replicative DNA helicase [Paludibacteraceae bacterium]